jgi:2-methylaconitate cis-trans-isomerase PrpF
LTDFPLELDVRIFNTNTSRVIVDTVRINDDGTVDEDGDYAIPGVRGTGSEIKVSFMDPAGSMTGKLFPTGLRTDTITVKERNGACFSVKATLIDAANPFILVDASTLPAYLKTCAKDSAGYLEHMESIRRVGAVMMGLASSTEAAAKVRGTPKLALVSPAPVSAPTDSPSKEDDESRIQVLAFSMGKPHPSLQLTGAACLGVAACVKGTVAWHISSGNGANVQNGNELLDELSRGLTTTKRFESPPTPSSPTSEDSADDSASSSSSPRSGFLKSEQRFVKIFHASGSIEVGVVAASADDWAVVERCSVSRTARRLFDGTVYYYQ